MNYVYVIAGALVGAPLRYFVGSRAQSAFGTSFPWGTLLVNLTGCFAIGLLLGLAEEKGFPGREARLLLVTGFLGSYTTFSTFGWETYALFRADEVLRAMANITGSVVVGVLAAWAGAALGRAA